MKNDIFSPIQQLFTVDTYVNRGITLTRGEGVFLYDLNDQPYLDLMSNYGVNIFGYNHPQILSALQHQLKTLTTLHSSFGNDVRAMAAKKLVKRCGHNLTKVFFSNSGSEAVEAALKFAVLATNKKRFIVAKDGYHGKTLGALSATQSPKYKKSLQPLLWEFQPVSFGDINALSQAIDDKTAGVILEPIQGEGGVYLPPLGYFQEVQKLCEENNILLILDEIQTGCGRTGTFLASEEEINNYDIVCLGKGLAAGIPIGATLVNEKVSNSIPKHIHTSTFGGNPLACAGVTVTLELLDKEMLTHVRKIGEYFHERLLSIKSKNIKAVRAKGLMNGIEVKENRDAILKDLQQRFILAIPAGEKVIRLLPPLTIQKEHIDQAVEALSATL